MNDVVASEQAGKDYQLALPWLFPVMEHFIAQLLDERFPSAVLLSGPEGVGKIQLAEAIAAALLCRPAREAKTGKVALPCGECKSCRLMSGQTHPDFLEVVPEETGKMIKVDQVRSLTDFVYARPQIAPRRVVLLHPAEAMNLNASNALLKTLEEPSPDTFLILVSSHPARLLPTIRSRCLKTNLTLPTSEVARRWVSERWTGEGVDRALANAHGAPLRALEALEGGDEDQRLAVLEAWKNVLSGTQDVFATAEDWSKLEPEKLLDWLMSTLHGQARSATLGLSEAKVHGLYGELLEIARGVSEKRNLSLQLLWENWLIRSKARD